MQLARGIHVGAPAPPCSRLPKSPPAPRLAAATAGVPAAAAAERATNTCPPAGGTRCLLLLCCHCCRSLRLAQHACPGWRGGPLPHAGKHEFLLFFRRLEYLHVSHVGGGGRHQQQAARGSEREALRAA